MFNNIDNILDLKHNFDLGKRTIEINNQEVHFYFVSGLINSEGISLIMDTMIENNGEIPALQIKKVIDSNDFVSGVLSGLLGIIMEEAYLIDYRQYPSRNPSEPDNEKVIRGARDGFTENIIINSALIRRRVRTPCLVNILHQIGSRSKTDVSMMYIKDLADEKIVKAVSNSLEKINTKEITMGDKALEELMLKNRFNPYPLVRYTERPDNVAAHLFQGQIAILVDNSPSVILAPTTLFEHLEHAEEYRERPLVGTFLRLLRISGILMSLFLMPLWVLFAINDYSSIYILTGDKGDIPLIVQVLIAEIGIEFLRLASIHTPSSLSTALGVIAGILIGQMAIEAGFFSLEIVLYTAISQIGSYATPSYELALANKISKIFLILGTYFFSLWGLIISVALWFIYLMRTKSFGKPYLYPLVPFSFKKLLQVIIRFPKDSFKNR